MLSEIRFLQTNNIFTDKQEEDGQPDILQQITRQVVFRVGIFTKINMVKWNVLSTIILSETTSQGTTHFIGVIRYSQRFSCPATRNRYENNRKNPQGRRMKALDLPSSIHFQHPCWIFDYFIFFFFFWAGNKCHHTFPLHLPCLSDLPALHLVKLQYSMRSSSWQLFSFHSCFSEFIKTPFDIFSTKKIIDS